MSREDIDPDLELIKTEVESERDEQEPAEPVTEKTFKCPICERTYKCKRYLRDHMNIHKEKFVCQECGLCFRRQSILDAHVLTHSGVKLFSCLNCDEPFANTLDLNRHYKSCLKEENYYPFECEICHQGLKTKLGLQRHLANHNGPYGCDVCGSRYQSSSTLLRHKKIHKERPFSCQKCEFRSVDRQGLTKHQKICRGKKRVARHVLRLDGDEFAVLVRPEDSHLFPYPNIAEEDCLGNHVATELSGRIAEHGEEKRSHGVVPMRKQIYSLLGEPLADDPLLPKLEPSSPAAVHKSPKFSVEEPPVKKNRSGRNIGGLLKQMKEDFDKRLEQQKKDFERRLQLQKELFDKKILLLRNHVEDLAKVVMAIDKEANKLGLELEQFPEQQESNEKEAPR